jgi:excisionase family DNA binding protein
MKTDFMTIDELAKVLKVPKSWLYSRTRQCGPGTIPRIKIGKYLRFEEEKVMRWLREKNREKLD